MKKQIKIPIILFSKSGYEQLFTQREELQKRRPAAVQTLSKARALGDLSENSLYRAAKQELRSLDNRVARLDGLIKFGKPVQLEKNDKVQIGSIVTYDQQGTEKTVEIVGDFEANPSKNKISYKSPIGNALFNSKQGSVVVIEAPSKKIKVTITNVKNRVKK